MYWWHAGHRFAAINRKYSSDGKHGKAVPELARQLELSTQDINAAMRFVERYPKDGDLTTLLAKRDDRGKPLTWAHIRLLITDDISDAKRATWIDQCLAERWTYSELSLRLAAALGARGGQNGELKGGAPIVMPPSIGAMISKWRQMNGVQIKFGKAVFGSKDGIASVIQKTPPDRIMPDMLNQLDQLKIQVETIRDLSDSELASISMVKAHVSAVINGKAQAAGDDDDEPDNDGAAPADGAHANGAAPKLEAITRPAEKPAPKAAAKAAAAKPAPKVDPKVAAAAAKAASAAKAAKATKDAKKGAGKKRLVEA